MAIRASLKGPNLFSSLPSVPPPNDPASHSSPPPPPIPIPKYPPPKTLKSQKPPINPAFNTIHRRTKYFKPVREGVISSDGDRAVTVGESGVSYHLPGAPFEFQFSYSETPKVKPLAIREPAFLPFAPPTMPRPWTGKAPLKKSKKKTPLFDSFLPPPPGLAVVKEMPGAFPFGKYPKNQKSREEILGEPLKKWEVQMFLKQRRGNRQVNLGRDGLTHNMLELIHSHWRRQSVCKVRCKGVPTVDMKNICRHLEHALLASNPLDGQVMRDVPLRIITRKNPFPVEILLEKTGGKIILRVGGVVYLFRGRNYDHRTRPQYPVMLWKPAAPVYPKLIQDAPEGLTKSEADELRKKGKKLLPICKLAKNGVYITLVKDVRHAFEASPIVKIDCKGMHATDYKKLGAKLKELVPCVLLSFDDEQILIWRGQDWKSMYRTPLIPRPREVAGAKKGPKTVRSSPKMMSLWQRAIDSSKAFVLDKTDLGPDELLKKVEEFEGMSQTAEHSYPAVVLASKDPTDEFDDGPPSQGYGEEDSYYRYSDGDDDGYYDSDSDEEEITSSAPLGSLPVDRLAERLIEEKNEKNRWFDRY